MGIGINQLKKQIFIFVKQNDIIKIVKDNGSR